MGLRENKRQRVHAAIIENAIALFRESGFEATPVREIARRSDISEATFFNYFAAKEAVLQAWAEASLESAFEAASVKPATGLRRTIRTFADHLAGEVEADRKLCGAVWPRLRVGAITPPAAAVRLLREGQAQEEVRRDLAPEELAQILTAVAASAIAGWLSREPTGEAGLRPALRRALDLVLDGSRRRNARVRPGAAS